MRTMSAGEARRALASMDRDSKRGGGSGSALGKWFKRGAVALLALFMVTLPVGWALGWFSTPAQVVEVRAVINQQIADLDKVAAGQVPYNGGPDMGQVSGKMRDLPEEMRDQVRRDIGRLREASERAQVNSFFNVPPAQREAELDRRIKAEDERRKQWMADRAKNRGGGGREGGRGEGGGRPQGGGPGAMAAAGGGGGGGGRGGPGGGGGPGRGFGEEDRNNRRKAMLDNSNPGGRARVAEYRRQMDERRQLLGGGGGGGGRGGR